MKATEMMCDDVRCAFKQRHTSANKLKGECMLSQKDAIKFMNRYECSTCEVGMGQVGIHDSDTITTDVIAKLKYFGRV